MGDLNPVKQKTRAGSLSLFSSPSTEEAAAVREEASLVDGLEKGAFDWVEVPCPVKVSQIVSEYEKQHDALTKRLKAIPTAKWETKMPFLFDGQEVMRETGYDMAWGFLLDQIHHRGQLSTYLRPMGAKVPAIYGPSADEQS